MGVIP
ncbi:hypothetical protein N499_0861A, partial [Wolbachia pipientis wVitA]